MVIFFFWQLRESMRFGYILDTDIFNDSNI